MGEWDRPWIGEVTALARTSASKSTKPKSQPNLKVNQALKSIRPQSQPNLKGSRGQLNLKYPPNHKSTKPENRRKQPKPKWDKPLIGERMPTLAHSSIQQTSKSTNHHTDSNQPDKATSNQLKFTNIESWIGSGWGWSPQSFKYFSKSFPMWVGCSLFWQLCTYLYSFHTQWKSGWLVILFNPTIPQSVPRSNNLTSSPDKRGFPTRNAASPLSSYLSCLLSHHITSPQTQKKHWQTQHHNTTLNTTSQHNT